MNSVEISAKTVDEAVEEGLKTLGVNKDNVEIEVLSEPSQGILKLLGSKPAKVRLTVLTTPEEYIKEFLQNLVEKMGVNGEVIEQVNGSHDRPDDGLINFEVTGNNLGVLIGKRGNTLNAIQYLANVVYQRQFQPGKGRVLLDIENYRQKRKKTLEQLANSMASKAKRNQKEVVLEPMTPQERRIIHMTLKDNEDVKTYSKGNEPFRKVVIAPR